VVSSIVRQHNGHVNFLSGENGETIFQIFLPTTEVPAPMREDFEPPAGRLLVMDDEDGVRSMAARMLRHLGHTVETASDGEEALGLFTAARDRGAPFDLVILDLAVQGGMGGEETLRRLHDLDPGIKAVVMSGYAGNTVMRDHRSFGFAGLLRKPFELDELRRVVNTALTGFAPEPTDHRTGQDQDRWVQEQHRVPRFRRRF
jgi:CheY-like chemotaxis protein